MSSGFSFGGIKVDSKKQVLKLRSIDSPVLVDRTLSVVQQNPVTVIVDEYYEPEQISHIEKFLRRNKLYKYIILCPLKYKISRNDIQEDQNEGVIKFYRKNASDFRDYIIPGSPILVSGPGLYSLLQEDDIYPSHVQQRIFGISNFWFSYDLSNKGNWVYPIEAFRDLFAHGFSKGAVDSYKTKLAYAQIRDLREKPKMPPRYPKLNKIFISSKQEFYDLFYEPNKNRRDELLAVDLETSGFNYFKDTIGCITMSFNFPTGYYIPWEYVDVEKLDEIFGNNRLLGQNLKFDLHFLLNNGIKNIHIDEDTYILGHTLDETRSNSLKALAFLYSEYGGYERALDKYKERYNIDNYLEIDEDILKEYAIMDAIVTRRVYDNMINHLRWLDKTYPNEKYPDDTLEVYYRYRRIPAVNMYFWLEHEGVYINKDKLDSLRKEMQKAIKDIREELSEIFGVSKNFNWSSSEKVGRLLQNKGWEDFGKSEKGVYKVGKPQLDRWAKTHPEVKLLKSLSSYETLIDSFVGNDEGTKGWSQYLIHHDGDPENVWRMHPSWQAMGTDSGRTRCNSPNMQNTPTRGKFTKEIKDCLCTPDDENYYMVTIDYSALQLRLSAIDSEDRVLTSVFTSPKADVHSQTSYNIFGQGKQLDVEIIDVEDESGSKHQFLGGELIETKRGEIFARDLREDDELILD